ncbi:MULTISPECIES: Imm1 family immunity protein [unclassified Nostoc]|uniref:Imm1 family immunity protein n=1 Tax=unclassified Nostoc TaxID=2593658 RepID=UPI002AD4C441|nr:Imm1 family immunity protein [Nostoc sp. DedQUE03]MDZ7972004.1 Imm1 family immunity protein [Nostoc sp. DedQUE03]MDZ8043807.1 Imm1 family immunity protein [Nostoc sp. DedQUE02]
MCSNSQETTPQPSPEDTKANGESPRLLTPEQVRAGTNVIMSYAERQAFLKNFEIGKLLGFDRWPDLPQKSQISLVFKLSAETWLTNSNQGELRKDPNWIQIEAAIRDLDGKNKTLVTLKSDDETYMNIGGGKSDKYVVNVTFNNTKFYVLVNLSKSDEIENFVVAGQQVNYPAKMCVDLLHCLLAARTFTESGKLEPLLSWEEDKSLVTV